MLLIAMDSVGIKFFKILKLFPFISRCLYVQLPTSLMHTHFHNTYLPPCAKRQCRKRKVAIGILLESLSQSVMFVFEQRSMLCL